MLSGDFSSEIFIRGQNLVGGWSRIFGSALFSEFRFAYNRVRSDSVHPAFGIDANAQFGIKGVPQDPRFYGGLPHTQTADVLAHRRTVLPAAVPDVAGLSSSPRTSPGARGATRSSSAASCAVTSSPTSICGRSTASCRSRLTLQRHRPRRHAARPGQHAAADAVPSARPVHRRGPVLRPGLVAGQRHGDGQLRHPLRVLHAHVRSQRPAHQHRARDGPDRAGAGFRQRLRPDPDQSRPQRLGAARRRRLVDQGQRRDARRLRHLLPADRPLRVRKPARTQPAAAGRRVDLGQLGQRGAGVHLRPGLHAAQPVDGQSRHRAVAHPGPGPADADRASVQRRPRVAVRVGDGGGGRVRRQPRPQRPAAAQPQSGHHRHQYRDDAHRLPVRAVRLRQRVSRTDHHRRPHRLQRAADPPPAPDDRRPRLHRRLHVRRAPRATSSIT